MSNGTHLAIATGLAEAGVDILREKPLEVTPERVNRLIDACEREGVTLGGIFQRRTYGGPRLARRAVANGRLSDVILADMQVKWYREASYYDDVAWHRTTDLDGGVLLTQALHGVDLLQCVTGGIETLRHDVDAPDTAAVSVEFSQGGYGQPTAIVAVYPQRPITFQVYRTEGTIQWHEDELVEFVTKDGPVDAEPDPFPAGVRIPKQVHDFVDSISEDRDPMVPPEEARDALDVVFAAQRSADLGEWVDVADVREE